MRKTVSAERRKLRLLWLAAGCLITTAAHTETDGTPDSEFLEYLGSWDESDEDWLTVAEWPGQSTGNRASDKEKDERKDDEQES